METKSNLHALAVERPMHRLNLNLLYPLHAILHAPTLTEAGRRVRLSQSAMSHALRRLRDHFGDDLVTHSSGDQYLTPLGMALRTEVRRVMQEVEGTFNYALEFDPLTAAQTITIATPEAIEQMLLGPVLRDLSNEAPGLSVRMVPLDMEVPQRALDQGADLLLLSEDSAIDGLEILPILTDHASCMVWSGHPEFGASQETSEEQYLAARHIVPQGEVSASLAADDVGYRILKARRIWVRTTSQATLPAIVIGSDLVATGSAWLFQYYASIMPLKVITAPFPTRETVFVAQWANHRRRDPMLAWFVKRIQEQAGLLLPRSRS
ncbi:MAG: LysR family transcriptional regulator [Alphaproteobacteria bacterium]|nr:LysR family transcriptional regulator [Alphaproteobacteria bacterium]MBU0874787.1 LysR family transcriptional regulator [Alphaproteobacteria bacterium]MBU1768645.1 LysR family transcriptional regulator [Alphaproteobacteria bacterium]